MPHAAPRQCARCRQVQPCGCDTKRRRETDERRGSREERGYTWQWRRFREAYIDTVVSDTPWCLDCKGAFGSRSEIELHHVRKLADHPELRFEAANIRHLCCRCHSIRTARGE